jgi:hypothetical protein
MHQKKILNVAKLHAKKNNLNIKYFVLHQKILKQKKI